MAAKAKLDKSVISAIKTRDAIKLKLPKIQNYFDLVNKWRINAAKKQDAAYEAYQLASETLMKAENKRIELANRYKKS
jgi:hypothetical protein